MINMENSKRRTFYALKPGTRFKALITDIQPGKVTIRIDGGASFTARTRLLPEARIGEESFFVVRENNMRGLIQLEIINPSDEDDNNNEPHKRLIFDTRI